MTSTGSTSSTNGPHCDPKTGICRLPPPKAKDAQDAQDAASLPKNLRVLSMLEDEQGNVVDSSVFHGKMVAVYASASWCPPCHQFSPTLAEWAKERSDEVIVVLVSFDKTEDAMKNFVGGKGFLRLPFEPESERHRVAETFGVQTLPSLIIVNGDTGAIVTTWGRSAVVKNPSACLEEWKAGRDGVTWLQLLRPW